VLAGRDLMAAAQTGTGKTAGFTLPILQSCSAPGRPPPGKPRVLVLTPTRELAAQVEESVRTYGQHLPLKTALVFGGVGINPQIEALKARRRHPRRHAGPPARPRQQRTVDLSGIEILVLDEADRMLDMGFIRDIRKIIALLPKQKQNLLFSATFSDEIRGWPTACCATRSTGRQSRRATPPPTSSASASLRRPRGEEERPADHLIDDHRLAPGAGVHAHQARRQPLAEKLNKAGISAAAIHGNKSQGARTRALADFKERQAGGAGGHRHRRARPRHRPAAARGQLRAAQRARGLRAPHRPHRPRRHARARPSRWSAPTSTACCATSKS
jgi:ATP-dependent RNA helicase RhlE